MLGLGVRNRLDHDRELVIQALSLREHAQVLGILQELRQARLHRVTHGDLQVVYCRLGVFVEFLVNAHRVHELDWRQRPQVTGDVVLQIRDMTLINEDDLKILVSIILSTID